jgi:hypothetical protein
MCVVLLHMLVLVRNHMKKKGASTVPDRRLASAGNEALMRQEHVSIICPSR